MNVHQKIVKDNAGTIVEEYKKGTNYADLQKRIYPSVLSA